MANQFPQLEQWLQAKSILPSRVIIPLVHPDPCQLDSALAAIELDSVLIVSASEIPATDTSYQQFLAIAKIIAARLESSLGTTDRVEAQHQIDQLLMLTETKLLLINCAHHLSKECVQFIFDWSESHAEAFPCIRSRTLVLILPPDKLSRLTRKSRYNPLPDYMRQSVEFSRIQPNPS